MSNVSWQDELNDLIATANTPDEKKAMEAFAQAIRPHLDNPEMLRTLLSKIQRRMSATVGIVTGDQSFSDMDDLRKQMPTNVNVIEI
jgi:hypothetical protein